MGDGEYSGLEYGLITAFVLGIVACYIAVVVTFQDGTQNTPIIVPDPNDANVPWDQIQLIMLYKMYAFDPLSYTYKGTAAVLGAPKGATYTALIDWTPRPLTYSFFDVTYYSIDQSIEEGTPDGNLLLYPFETYQNSMYFAVVDANGTYIPFSLTNSIEFYGFNIINLQCLCDEDSTTDNVTFQVSGPWSSSCGLCEHGVNIRFQAERRRSTIAFALIVTIVSWFLVFALTALTIDTIVRKRDIIPPLLGFCAGCLFALPTVRNAQPNIPPAGVWIDFMGYFFQISLVGLDLVALTCAFVFRWNPPKKT